MTMTTIRGPAIFLAQFAGDAAPFNSLTTIAEWAASLGYKGVQIPVLGRDACSTSIGRRTAMPIATR